MFDRVLTELVFALNERKIKEKGLKTTCFELIQNCACDVTPVQENKQLSLYMDGIDVRQCFGSIANHLKYGFYEGLMNF